MENIKNLSAIMETLRALTTPNGSPVSRECVELLESIAQYASILAQDARLTECEDLDMLEQLAQERQYEPDHFLDAVWESMHEM